MNFSVFHCQELLPSLNKVGLLARIFIFDLDMRLMEPGTVTDD